MVLRVDVVDAALRAVGEPGPPRPPRGRVVVLAPSGRQFDDALAVELAGLESLTLLSGRYEGIDERCASGLPTTRSIGPYVLSGGEPAAMVIADAVMRKLPGALGDEQSAVEESFSEALEGGLEYPHYARLLPGMGGTRGPSVGPSRPGAHVAARAGPPPHLLTAAAQPFAAARSGGGRSRFR